MTEENFNITEARNAWAALLKKFEPLKAQKTTKAEQGVFSNFEKEILNQDCPKACLTAGQDKTYYIPANFLKEMISTLFEDRWNTEIISQDIICQERSSLNFENGQPEIQVQKLIGQVSLKLTIFSKDGTRSQSHTSLGIMGGDQKTNSAQYMKLFRIAIKGAETNALRTALSKFGKIFTTYEEEDYQNLKNEKKEISIPETRKIKSIKFYPLVSAEKLIVLETSSPEEWSIAYQDIIHHNKDNIITLDRILTNNKKILTEVKRELRKIEKEKTAQKSKETEDNKTIKISKENTKTPEKNETEEKKQEEDSLPF